MNKNKEDPGNIRPLRALISFPRSDSRLYTEAAGLARELPGYSESGHGGKMVHRVDMPLSLARPVEWGKARRLAILTADLEGASLELDGTTAKSFEELDLGVLNYADIDPESIMKIIPRDAFPQSGLGTLLAGAYEKVMKTGGREIPPVRYADVYGQDAALEAVKKVVQLPLTHPDYFAEMGLEPQRGIILYGPPGNGKTLIARAVATESRAHLEIINGPEVLSKWVGESEERLRGIFQAARDRAPSIILIDEMDSLAPGRESASSHHEVQLVSQLLVLLDGLESRGRVAVIATTNRIDAIDPAARRSGRFDYHILVPAPDEAGRISILNGYLSRMKVEGGLDTASLSARAAGYSGADLASLCREAGMSAIQRGISLDIRPGGLAVTAADMENALESLKGKRRP